MSNEQNFLIRYGLHNFVTHVQTSSMQSTFFIESTESQNMVGHALTLIKDRFGDSANVQLA
ncbi:MAG: hypothetical protein QF394_11835 [Rhodospirillales bacterium]|jgi:hypothetical protein|nr:hypothetical protein [Rhodospirillales bacterium]|tara:strand:- start:2099 stop:2281 length:183 start_codon:yes stop_codon:yes gene_type:complete